MITPLTDAEIGYTLSREQIYTLKSQKLKTVTRLGQDRDKTGTRPGQDWDKTGTRLGQDRDKTGTRRLGQDCDKTGTRLGQDWDKTGTRPGQDWDKTGASMSPIPTSPAICTLPSGGNRDRKFANLFVNPKGPQSVNIHTNLYVILHFVIKKRDGN